jgi:hypothetical protein
VALQLRHAAPARGAGADLPAERLRSALLLVDARDEHVLPEVPRVLAALRAAGFELAGVGYHHPARTFAELRPLLVRMARFWDTFVVATSGSADLAAVPRALLENLIVGGVCGYDYADWRVVAAPRCVGVVHVWPAMDGVPLDVAEILRDPALVSILLTLRAPADMGLAEMSELIAVPEKLVRDDVSVLMQMQAVENEPQLVAVAFVG